MLCKFVAHALVMVFKQGIKFTILEWSKHTQMWLWYIWFILYIQHLYQIAQRRFEGYYNQCYWENQMNNWAIMLKLGLHAFTCPLIIPGSTRNQPYILMANLQHLMLRSSWKGLWHFPYVCWPWNISIQSPHAHLSKTHSRRHHSPYE